MRRPAGIAPSDDLGPGAGAETCSDFLRLWGKPSYTLPPRGVKGKRNGPVLPDRRLTPFFMPGTHRFNAEDAEKQRRDRSAILGFL